MCQSLLVDNCWSRPVKFIRMRETHRNGRWRRTTATVPGVGSPHSLSADRH